jgi:long-chain acyl-CoA synthetase
MNLASIIGAHPEQAPALIGDDAVVTYGELHERVAMARRGLAQSGVEPGDRVALLSTNDVSFVVSYLAVLGLGGVAVPLNPGSPSLELERELATVKPRVVIAPSGAGLANSVDVDQLSSSAGDVPAVHAARPDDLAVLVFTSGTAGRPRAAMLTHGNLLANIAQLRASDPALAASGTATPRPSDVALGALPMFHIYGLNVVLGFSLAIGSAVVLIERFDPQATLDAVERHGVTVIAGVPTLWSVLAQLPAVRRDAFAKVRLATSGAAPLDVTVAQAVHGRLGVRLVEGYGLTEASPAVTTGLGVDAPQGSVGRPLPDVELRLVDSDGQDVLVGDPGEIWVRGPNVFAGYWEDPEATAMVLTPDGWLRTGDIAVVDDAGFLYLVDRAKDLIIVSGFNVYPSEVEEVIAEHPGVADVAVLGQPDPHTGEAVTAYVVPTVPADDAAASGGQQPVTESAILDHCALRLASYKCPSAVLFVDEIPHNVAGKIVRRALR